MNADYSKHRSKVVYALLIVVFVLPAYIALNYIVPAQTQSEPSVQRQKSNAAIQPSTPPPAQAKPVSTVPVSRINQVRSFTLYSETGRKTKVLKAGLRAEGRHADIWVDTAETVRGPLLTKLITQIDGKIYPNNTKYFANNTGRKKVGRLSILITGTGNLDGYFDSRDIDSQNKLNLIYVNSSVVKNELPEAYNTLAHEFEHLLFYQSGGADVEWLDEGMAVYAEYLNGNFPSLYVSEFSRNPNVKLDGQFSNANNYYGAAFLFVSFSVQQVQLSNNSVPSFFQDLIDNSGNGATGVSVVLHRYIENKNLDSYAEIYRTGQLMRHAASMKN